jgi:ribosomal protein L37E
VNRSVQKHLPSNVRWFEQLMYLSLGLSLIEAPLESNDWNRLVADTGSPYFAVFAASFICAFAALIWQAAREHKNWARWVLLILFALSLLATFHHFEPSARFNLLAGILIAGEFLAWGAALFLIFTGNGRSWFEPFLTCSKCGAVQYSRDSAFCTRCGSSTFRIVGRSYNIEAPRTGWKSLPFIVRLAIYIVCIPPIIGAIFWTILILIGLTAGSR